MNGNRSQKRSKAGQAQLVQALQKQVADQSQILTKCLVVNTILMRKFNITEEDINREYATLITQQRPTVQPKHDPGPKSTKDGSVQSEDKPSDVDSGGSSESGVPRGASDDSDQASPAAEVQSGVRSEDDGSNATSDAG